MFVAPIVGSVILIGTAVDPSASVRRHPFTSLDRVLFAPQRHLICSEYSLGVLKSRIVSIEGSEQHELKGLALSSRHTMFLAIAARQPAYLA